MEKLSFKSSALDIALIQEREA
jgi:hypothetical protein